jgi:hypothetical protein
MKLTTLLATIGLGFCLAPSAHAEFVIGDYLTEGDQLTVIDTKSSVEWLNISLTKGQSANATLARIDSGELLGWRVAIVSEVSDMFGNFFSTVDWMGSTSDNYTAYYNDVSRQEMLLFQNMFDNIKTPGYDFSGGYALDDTENILAVLGPLITNNNYLFYPINRTGRSGLDTVYSHIGTFLVRDYEYVVSNVPVPLSLSALFLLGLGVSRRPKQAQ